MKILHTLSVQIIGSVMLSTTYAQTPNIEWSNSFGGPGDEEASQIILTQDNGYIIFGKSASNFSEILQPEGDTNILVAKIDSTGTIQWQKSLGGTCEETFKQAIETENGYIILGQTCSSNKAENIKKHYGKGDIWLVKIDHSGNLIWQNNLGGSHADHPIEIIKANDGGFMILSQTFSSDGDVKTNKGSGDIWISNISNEGALIWERSFGGSGRETPVQITTVAEGGYFVLAQSGSEDGDVLTKRDGINIWALRISNEGALLWQNSIGGSKTDLAKQILCNEDGDFIVLGQTLSRNGDVRKAHGSYDIWVTKLNHQGEILWQNTLGGSKKEFPKEIIQSPRGGYLISGYTDSFDGDITLNAGKYDVWLVKITEEGVLDWQKSLGGRNEDYPEQIVCTKDGGYIMLGSAEGASNYEGLFDCWIVKLSANGAVMWEKTVGGSDHDIASKVLMAQDGNYIFSGCTRSKDGDISNSFGAEDVWVFKLSLKTKKEAQLEGFVPDNE